MNADLHSRAHEPDTAAQREGISYPISARGEADPERFLVCLRMRWCTFYAVRKKFQFERDMNQIIILIYYTKIKYFI